MLTLAIIGCDNSQLRLSASKNVIVYDNGRVLSSGYYSLPEGDFRGGGALFVDSQGFYFDARVIVDGKEKFYKLAVDHPAEDKQSVNYSYYPSLPKQQPVAVELERARDWVVKLDDMSNDNVKYSAFQSGVRVFSISLPKIDQAGYVVGIGKVSIDRGAELFYFQTLKVNAVKKKPPIQKAVVAYVLVKPEV